MTSGSFGDLAPRVVSALVLVAAAVATVWIGGDTFAVFWLLTSFAVYWEWQGLIGAAHRVARVVAGGFGLAVISALARTGELDIAALECVVVAALVSALAGPGRRLWAAAGFVYAAALVVSVCILRDSPEFGLVAIAWLFAVVWGTDVFAYFGGRLIGGPKLWPQVSAGKTWSGTLVGALAGALLGLAVARIGGGPQTATAPLFLAGLAGSGLAQLGDLFESAVKRRFGVKDSSNLIPGHGGVMDRVDGFIFASGFAATLGALHGHGSAAAGLFSW
jgi:phosphatidate cytidylyltransferase